MKEQINGWLSIDKPAGISSARALVHIKRLCKPFKVGHAGTLDPFASGLLLVAIGEATKTIPFAMDKHKEYTFTIKWGETTDTEDCTGTVTASSDALPPLDEINKLLPSFTGQQWQTPPIFSAAKIGGKRAYRLARQGEEVVLSPKEVYVHDFKVINHQNDSTDFKIKCGKGFYIRALARDICAKLRVHGHVNALTRTCIGDFSLDDAIPLAKIEKITHNEQRESLKNWLKPITAVLDDILVLQCNQEQALDLLYGRVISGISGLPKDGLVCLVMQDNPIALCNVIEGNLHPARVFNIK